MDLYPQEPVIGTTPHVDPAQEETHKISRLKNYPLDKLQKHFIAIKTGKGAGPFSDSTGIFRNLALHTPSYGKTCPYLETVWHYLCLFATNDHPNNLFSKFPAVWLTLLFKQWPMKENEPPQYHPIGAGTGIR
eukprot:5067480-Ditylum_brightwellii.AAC.1